MKLSGLQIARGLAALSIVYFHSWVILLTFPKGTDWPILALKLWGYLSIDFFFAISGFVICLVVSKPAFSPREFIVKRVFRLYPMLWICMSAYAATGIFRGPVPTETVGFFLYSGTLLPTNGYPFYDVAWSLQHEMLFYVLAAIVVPFTGIRGLACILFASAVAATWLDIPLHDLPISKYHADFLAGILAFWAAPHLKRIGAMAPMVIGCGLLWLVAANGLSNFFFAPFFALIVAAANFQYQGILTRPFVSLGDASYSLYLVHPLVFGVGYKLIGAFQPLPLWTQEPIRWAAIVVCCAISYVTWRLIERPMIIVGERFSKYHTARSATAET